MAEAAPFVRLRWRKYLAALPLALLAVLALAVAVLDSAIGHRLLADALFGSESEAGLRLKVGRIDGSLFSELVLSDIAVRDLDGTFLKLPEAELAWRPADLLRRRLHVTRLVSRRGVLLRVPHLRPTSGSWWPQGDIAFDRIAIERLTVAPALLGVERKIDLTGAVRVRRGAARIVLGGNLGGADRLSAHFEAEEAADRFALDLDYLAPKGGLLAVLTGAGAERRLRIAGQGTWHDWHGTLAASQGGARAAALALHQAAGRGTLNGQVWPGSFASGFAHRALGPVLALSGTGTFTDGVLDGKLAAKGPVLAASLAGGVDLVRGAARGLALDVRPGDPTLLGPDGRLAGTRLVARLDGRWPELAVAYRLTVSQFAQDRTRLDGMAASGTARAGRAGWTIPVALQVGRIDTVQEWLNPRLVQGRASGTLTLAGGQLSARHIAVNLPGIAGDLGLTGDLARDEWRIGGPVSAHGVSLPGIGLTDARGAMALHLARGHQWDLGLSLAGAVTQVVSPALARLAGPRIALAATLASGHGLPLLVRAGHAEGDRLSLTVRGERLGDGRMGLVGQGQSADLGAFTATARFAEDGPHAQFLLRDPVPAAGLRDVRLMLEPAEGALAFVAEGQSAIGPFSGQARLALPAGRPARLDIANLRFSDVGVSGALDLLPAGPSGALKVAGGGVDGSVQLDPGGNGVSVQARLAARDAQFGGDYPLAIGEARLEAKGLIAHDRSTLDASLSGAGIGRGRLFLGRFAGTLHLVDGRGAFTASIAGRRGNRFDLSTSGTVDPGRIAVHALGSFAGQPIVMPRRAVVTRTAGGWELAPAELDFAGGRAIASGHASQSEQELSLALANVPLGFGDVVFPGLGLSGSASGLFHYAHHREQLPLADARLQLKGLSRAGLVLSSRPIDVGLVARLDARAFEARAVTAEGGAVRGRLQVRIGGLPVEGPLGERLRAGQLAGQMRYDGPADVPWRLLALDAFDLSGRIALSADLAGTLDNPRLGGTLAGDALRLQSALTGTDITQITARGAFSGSVLSLPVLAGHTLGGGEVVGSGQIDFARSSESRGPGIDLKFSAEKAQLLGRSDLALVATGPVRILSDGISGTIAARLAVNSARWRLGRASAVADLPVVATREINRSADVAPAMARGLPWRFLIDAAGAKAVRLVGMGIDSEWGAAIRLRGTTDAPAITGQATLVGGNYEFAGKRFTLTRGRIGFDGSAPPDPQLDIAASADLSGTNATVTVRGSALRPEIVFSSVPAMPEEELLARVLFGSSVSQISAPEALQLGAAVASLHGGGGLDPINKLRSAIGLDRLRIVSADAALGRQTGVAAGKYLGRRFYAEVVTDGRGYSATNLEFRVTSWLSLLGSVSTVGRQSVNARVSRDY